MVSNHRTGAPTIARNLGQIFAGGNALALDCIGQYGPQITSGQIGGHVFPQLVLLIKRRHGGLRLPQIPEGRLHAAADRFSRFTDDRIDHRFGPLHRRGPARHRAAQQHKQRLEQRVNKVHDRPARHALLENLIRHRESRRGIIEQSRDDPVDHRPGDAVGDKRRGIALELAEPFGAPGQFLFVEPCEQRLVLPGGGQLLALAHHIGRFFTR